MEVKKWKGGKNTVIGNKESDYQYVRNDHKEPKNYPYIAIIT